MPANDIGIDLGTTNCLVYSTGKGLVLQEPSVVVYDKDTEKIRAIGEEAKQMSRSCELQHGSDSTNSPGSDRGLCGAGKNAEIFYYKGNGTPGVS